MQKLILSISLQEPTEKGLSRVAATSIEIPSNKLLSPGVRSSVHLDLDNFLNSAANKSLLNDELSVKPRELHAKELEAIAKLVAEGSRILESIIFDEPSCQVLYLKLRRP